MKIRTCTTWSPLKLLPSHMRFDSWMFFMIHHRTCLDETVHRGEWESPFTRRRTDECITHWSDLSLCWSQVSLILFKPIQTLVSPLYSMTFIAFSNWTTAKSALFIEKVSLWPNGIDLELFFLRQPTFVHFQPICNFSKFKTLLIN